ncbi:MAG: NADPH-dependent FMN reductase, partial [Cyclobacteriaceae bacterium]
KPIWPDVPMFLLATSPGGRGAQLALKNATTSFPHQGANVVASFSLPSFGANFKEGEGIVEGEVKTAFDEQFAQFISSL